MFTDQLVGNNVTSGPFYTDMKFWALVVSLLALLLSQLPPVRLWRRVRLTVEAFSHLFITHKFGNPNAQLHLIVINSGGRQVRVTGISLRVSTNTTEEFMIPAASYLQKQGDKEAILFTPFTLKPEDEWAHIINFYPMLSRADDKLVRNFVSIIRADIGEKVKQRGEDKQPVIADDASVAPFMDLLKRQFKWNPNEYEMDVILTTVPPNSVPEQRFRFVLYESDTEDLRRVADGYKYGAGVFFDADERNNGTTTVPLQKIK